MCVIFKHCVLGEADPCYAGNEDHPTSIGKCEVELLSLLFDVEASDTSAKEECPKILQEAHLKKSSYQKGRDGCCDMLESSYACGVLDISDLKLRLSETSKDTL